MTDEYKLAAVAREALGKYEVAKEIMKDTGQEAEAVAEILRGAIDRDKGDETLRQLAVIAANGIHWRDVELAKQQQTLVQWKQALAEILMTPPYEWRDLDTRQDAEGNVSPVTILEMARYTRFMVTHWREKYEECWDSKEDV